MNPGEEEPLAKWEQELLRAGQGAHHTHNWDKEFMQSDDGRGNYKVGRKCLDCGLVQVKTPGISEFHDQGVRSARPGRSSSAPVYSPGGGLVGVTPPPPVPVFPETKKPVFAPNTVMVAYDPSKEELYFEDGATHHTGKLAMDDLFRANPGIDRKAAWAEVNALREPTMLEKSSVSLSKLGQAMADATENSKKLVDVFERFQRGLIVEGAFRNALVEADRAKSSDEALKVIVEEITHSEDPFVTGGEWLTKVTRQITDAIREAEDG